VTSTINSRLPARPQLEPLPWHVPSSGECETDHETVRSCHAAFSCDWKSTPEENLHAHCSHGLPAFATGIKGVL